MHIDCGQDDPIPYVLGSWGPVAGKVREHLERMHGRTLTQFDQQDFRKQSPSNTPLSSRGGEADVCKKSPSLHLVKLAQELTPENGGQGH